MATAEDSAVADFLQILEEHRRNCERQGKYVEAEIAKNRLEELKVRVAWMCYRSTGISCAKSGWLQLITREHLTLHNCLSHHFSSSNIIYTAALWLPRFPELASEGFFPGYFAVGYRLVPTSAFFIWLLFPLFLSKSSNCFFS
jgi:hypothetical protein